MTEDLAATRPGWAVMLREHARLHTPAALGVLLMLGLDEFTPHEHDKTGPCGPGHERCGRIWLFVWGIPTI